MPHATAPGPDLLHPGAAAGPLDWHVAVYCMNEQGRLRACLDRIVADLAGCRAVVTVIVNGSTDGSLAVAEAAAAAHGGIEVYAIRLADKSNAINQFIHGLRRPARYYGAVDAYTFIAPGSFAALARRLEGVPRPCVVSGTCTNGRSMKALTRQTLEVGGLTHGQFHAFPAEFLDRMTARGIRLPVGLYRGDGFLGIYAAHDLDPQRNGWENGRVAGAVGATYEIPQSRWPTVADIKRQFRRRVRQQQGRLENVAMKRIMATEGFEAVPADVAGLVLPEVERHGLPPAGVVDRVFRALALRQVRGFRAVRPELLAPRLVRAASG